MALLVPKLTVQAYLSHQGSAARRLCFIAGIRYREHVLGSFEKLRGCCSSWDETITRLWLVVMTNGSGVLVHHLKQGEEGDGNEEPSVLCIP